MKDRRPVDELSVEELEQILAIKKREEREARLRKFRASGRAGSASVIEAVAPPAAPKPKSLMTRLFNGILLVVEIGAVIALLYILINSASLLQTLNKEVAQALAQPTLPLPSPTPLISAVVLPSGHTPPTSPGGAQPNLAEIPENLRPLVQALPAIVIPTPSPKQAIRMIISAINIDAPVVQGDSWEQLKKGIAQHIGTGDPGQSGNLVVSAHNDIFGELFRELDRLKPGDEVQVFTASQKFTYRITGTRLVQPTEVSVMNPTVSPTLTLISCYPYLVDTQRIIVFAELKK
ncbi:MAG: class D sortase [Chloroflexi bacterium]|nr:class D sortase [Chloroflexota bacterium]MBI5350401.1 class D sortase [Chloroflexota bacterium]MBI5713932.1 class D sortase [Chloroflexota bacterium]